MHQYTEGVIAKLYRRIEPKSGDYCLATVASEDGSDICGRGAKFAIEVTTSHPDGRLYRNRSVACSLRHLKRQHWIFFQEG